MADPDLLTSPGCCARLGISRWTWRRWVARQVAPQPVENVPGIPRWRRDQIEKFAEGLPWLKSGHRGYFTKARQRQHAAADRG